MPIADWKLSSPLFPFSQTSPEQGHHPSFLEKGSLQSEAEREALFAAEEELQNVRNSEPCVLQRAIVQCAALVCKCSQSHSDMFCFQE